MLHSCEKETFKQKHLMESVHPLVGNKDANVFENFCELHKGVAQCALRKQKCLVSGRAFLSVFGYSCKNMSKYCSQPLDHVLEAKVGSSSETCEAMLSYVDAFRVPIIVMENVEEMAKPESKSRNVAYLNKRYRSMGYQVDSVLLWAHHFYLPQVRKRSWTIAVNLKSFGFSKEEASAWLQNVFDTVRQLAIPPKKKLSKMLLPNSHKFVQAELDRRLAMRENRGISTRKGDPWPQVHKNFRKKQGVSESEKLSVPAAIAKSKWFNSMAVREQEVLAVSINIFKKSLVSVDVGQNIARATKWVKPNSLPTVTPAAKTYLTIRRNGKPINRLLLGYEAMLFQGLPANLWAKTTKLSDPQMMNLAGNAFPSTQCAAVMIAIFANFPAKMPQQNLFQCAREGAPQEMQANAQQAVARHYM